MEQDNGTASRRSSKRPAAEDRAISPPPLKRKTQGTVSRTAAADFFTPVSQKAKPRTRWSELGPHSDQGDGDGDGDGDDMRPTLLIGRYVPEQAKPEHALQRRKVAAFDLDSTLITTSSGKKHGTDATDWKWWHGSVPGRLRKLYNEEGYRVVILTNQAGLTLHPDGKRKAPRNVKDRVAAFQQKCNSLATQLDFPLAIYAATGKDVFRKPRTGMWDTMLRDHYGPAHQADGGVDLAGSMFVGDAGGRVATAKTAKDFSCSDRNLARNIGIQYFSPEEFFLGEEPRPYVRDFDPHDVPAAEGCESSLVAFTKSTEPEVVLFCGPPGAGKSTFYFRHLAPLEYERVNQDKLKSKDKCFKTASEALQDGRSVAIDNTNADADTRAQWVQLAKRHGVSIRCVWFKTPLPLCEHNDAVRSMNKSLNPESRSGLPKLAFTGFASRFVPPTRQEGFREMVEVDFRFRGTAEEYKIWARYW